LNKINGLPEIHDKPIFKGVGGIAAMTGSHATPGFPLKATGFGGIITTYLG